MQNLFSKYQSLTTKKQILIAVAVFILGLVILPNVIVYVVTVYASFKLIKEISFRRFFVGIFAVIAFFSFTLLFDDKVTEPVNTASQRQEIEHPALETKLVSDIATSSATTSNSEQGQVTQDNTENTTPKEETVVTKNTVDVKVTEVSETATSQYRVASVVDGDTIKLDMNGSIETIRLIGIDTPETVHPTKPVECMGIEASNEAKRLLVGQTVRFESDNTQDTRDRYSRLLGYVFLPDGRNYGEAMIRSGFAYEYTYSSVYKYQSLYKQAQNYAQNNKLGLWADGVCDEEVAAAEPAQTPQSSAAPTSDGHKWYVSSHYSSKFYYCEESDAWRGLSEKYLEVYQSEAALRAKYPSHTLHESCQ